MLTGGHEYDTTKFDAMWNSMPSLEWTLLPMQFGQEPFEDVSKWNYDVVVFYNHQDPGAHFTDKDKQNFISLMDKGVGMFVLHHAVAAYPFWPKFEKMAGAKFRSTRYYKDSTSVAKLPATVTAHLADASHPIAKSLLPSYTVVDEIYSNMTFAADDRVLLKLDDADVKEPLAWTHTYRKSRVFGTVQGHGTEIFANTNFRRMVEQAVAWVKPCAAGEIRAECPAPTAIGYPPTTAKESPGDFRGTLFREGIPLGFGDPAQGIRDANGRGLLPGKRP